MSKLTSSSNRRRVALALAAACTLSLAACKDGDDAPVPPALAASAAALSTTTVPPPPVIASAAAAGDLASVRAQLDAALGQAAACSADADCRTVAVGAKACGGPTGYRAYSAKTGSTAAIDALAQHERDLAAQAARESHQVSPCFMLADPGAHCEQRRCVTGPRQG